MLTGVQSSPQANLKDLHGFSVRATLAFKVTSEQTLLQALLLLTITLPSIRQLSLNVSLSNSWQVDLNPPPTHSHSLRTREFYPVKQQTATTEGLPVAGRINS